MGTGDLNPPLNISNTLLPYLPIHKLQDEENRKNVYVYVTNISDIVVAISLIDINNNKTLF
jgi:hypothetical protein